jgi:hypothetical protein
MHSPVCAPCTPRGNASGWAYDIQQDEGGQGYAGLGVDAAAWDAWRALVPTLEQSLGLMLALMIEHEQAAAAHDSQLALCLEGELVDLESLYVTNMRCSLQHKLPVKSTYGCMQ